MSGLTMAFSIWGVVACILVALLIYRTILGNHEEDQLFLDRAEAALERNNLEVIERINRLDPVILWVGITAGAMLLAILGWWFYQGLNTPPVS